MFLSNLKISNFRCFGEGPNSFEISLRSGLTAVVGENDTGKTAVLDALRFALGTTDLDWSRVEDSDFHDENLSLQITIQCQFSLEPDELAVKGGVKLDHWGGGKLDQMSVREMGISGEGGVWSGGLRSGLRTAFRPERKTPPSARDVVVI